MNININRVALHSTRINAKYILDNEQELWTKVRWSGGKPVCKCGHDDLYKLSDGRFKCKHCRRVFSDTTDTIAQHSNLAKWQWLYMIFTLSVQRSISVRETAKQIGVSITTAHRMLRKIRYYMSKEQISMGNVALIDEAHLGAWSKMRYSKKFDYMRKNKFMDPKTKRYTKSQIYAASSDKKEHIVCLVNEYNQCVIKHIRGQVNHRVVKTIIKQYNVSHIVSDESKLYLNIPNTTVEQCNHSKNVWLTPNGNTTNPVENRFSWVKRIYNSYHTHTSADNLQLYLNQIAFKINHTGQSPEVVFNILGSLCCSEYISHSDITQYLRDNEIVNKPKEIDQYLLDELLNNPYVRSIEYNHKRYK